MSCYRTVPVLMNNFPFQTLLVASSCQTAGSGGSGQIAGAVTCMAASEALRDFAKVVDPSKAIIKDWINDACDGVSIWSFISASNGAVNSLNLFSQGLEGGPIPTSFFTALTDLQVSTYVIPFSLFAFICIILFLSILSLLVRF